MIGNFNYNTRAFFLSASRISPPSAAHKTIGWANRRRSMGATIRADHERCHVVSACLLQRCDPPSRRKEQRQRLPEQPAKKKRRMGGHFQIHRGGQQPVGRNYHEAKLRALLQRITGDDTYFRLHARKSPWVATADWSSLAVNEMRLIRVMGEAQMPLPPCRCHDPLIKSPCMMQHVAAADLHATKNNPNSRGSKKF